MTAELLNYSEIWNMQDSEAIWNCQPKDDTEMTGLLKDGTHHSNRHKHCDQDSLQHFVLEIRTAYSFGFAEINKIMISITNTSAEIRQMR